MGTETVGSYNDFAKTRSGEGSAEILRAYSQNLTNWRLARAAELGISVEELHERFFGATLESTETSDV